MVCKERLRLIVEYRNATGQYAKSVSDLAELITAEGNPDTEPLRRACREAWENAERARVALAFHEGRHFCDAREWSDTPAKRQFVKSHQMTRI